MPFGVGQWEIIVLVAVLVLLFGSSRVPRIARDLGRSVREIKETVEGVDPRTPLKELERGPDEKTEDAKTMSSGTRNGLGS
jgi:sec-independent protein translocase protein TatA